MKVEIGNLKMAREALCSAQNALLHPRVSTSLSIGQSNILTKMIDEIDALRPIGSNGKHGDLHTPWCGCEDSPFKFCEGCERVIIYKQDIKSWVHEHNWQVGCFIWIRTDSVARPMLAIEV